MLHYYKLISYRAQMQWILKLVASADRISLTV